jgi:hypothetical protein
MYQNQLYVATSKQQHLVSGVYISSLERNLDLRLRKLGRQYFQQMSTNNGKRAVDYTRSALQSENKVKTPSIQHLVFLQYHGVGK